MAKLIQQVTKGDPDTLLVTDRANELIDALNALLNMQVQPAELGSFVVGDAGNAQLTLSPQLFESFGNAEKTGESCTGELVSLNPSATVSANTIYQTTQEDADNIAQIIANLERMCVSIDTLNGHFSNFVNTYLRVSSICNEDGTITTTLDNSYPTPQA
jgi:hypothetical protein